MRSTSQRASRMAANFIDRLRSYGSSAFRLACVLTMTLVATAAIGLAAYWVYTYQEREQAKQAEILRAWSNDLTTNLGMKLRTKTKVTEGMMRMALDFDGYPEFLKHPSNRELGFFLEWKDADGFTRIKKFVQVSEFTRILDDKGRPHGLNGQFSEFVSVADYTKLQVMEVGWNIKTDIPDAKSTTLQPAAPEAAADHCAPGINRQERLRRLAKHGQVRETGYGDYTAGTHSVTIMPYDGALISCR